MIKSIAIALVVLLLVGGCTLAPKPVTTPPPKPHITQPSPTSMAECNAPVEPRDGPATQQQAENLWGTDSDSLIDCGLRHHILITYVRKVISGLSGTK